MRPDLSVEISDLKLATPLIAASGTFGYGTEYGDVVDYSAIGAIAVKGLYLNPRPGAPPPRIWETPSGMLNAIGLQEIGITRFIEEKLPELRKLGPAVCACALVIGLASPVVADRHCSFARQSAFYAKEISAEASGLPVAACSAKMGQALDRLRDARIELEICTCAVAEEPLERWFKDHPSLESATDAACGNSADAINAISMKLLTEVENCF